MKALKKIANLVLAMALLCVAIPFAAASDDDDKYKKWQTAPKSAAPIIPLEKMIALLRPKLGGEILAIEKEFEYGRLVYEVKYIDKSGYVREIYVDPRNGRILSWEHE